MKDSLFFCLVLLASSIFFTSCKNKNAEQTKFDRFTLDESARLSSIAFGSCNKQWEDQSYWEKIAAQDPDLWIWMGDIIYSDTEDMEQLAKQYNIQKSKAEYKEFMKSTAIVGVWDDHDYGVNDGGNDYPKRKESRDLLFEFLDIDSSHEAWKREGAYQSYTFGPEGEEVKILLLDGRYFKDPLWPDKITEQRYLPSLTGTYLGEDQWDWLEKELSESTAELNLIVSGIQFLPVEHYFEKWANYPKERSRLISLLHKFKLKNPIFLSGDRHIAEFSKMEIDSSLTIYEVTSSGLTHSYEKADEENQYRVGELTGQKNFGFLRIDWESDPVKISLEIHELDGKVSQIQIN